MLLFFGLNSIFRHFTYDWGMLSNFLGIGSVVVLFFVLHTEGLSIIRSCICLLSSHFIKSTSIA